MSLQFSDRVAQQITSLASILRDLLKVMNPEAVEGEMNNQAQQASVSVMKDSKESRKGADDLLASLSL